ncbi:MAG TPA: IniB N-terminal domain-containing protein [Pseudonocardiaceae bacterium]|jgi:hypothetical protein
MEPVSTLHDFVLNLLSNPTSLTAFAADPQALLSSAGLSDISPADVNAAMPMVIDYAPAHLVPSLEAAQSLLPVDGLSNGPDAAIAHLTALASSVTATTAWVSVDGSQGMLNGGIANPDLGLGTSATVTGDLQSGLTGAFGFASDAGHANWEGQLSGLAGGLTDLQAYNGLSGGLDGDVINKVTGGELNANALNGATAFATNLVANPTDILSHPTDITNALTGTIGGNALPTSLSSDPTAVVTDTLHNVLGNLPTPGAIGGLTGLGGLTNVTSGLTNASGLTSHDPLSAVTSHLPAGVTDLVSGAISNVTSQLPAADALHSATSALHGVVGEATGAATSASPLNGVSASAIGDTAHNVTGEVTGALHSVLPDLGGDHGLLGL